ncbi:MAG: metallophosphoesterase [Chloroflexota bacterium]
MDTTPPVYAIGDVHGQLDKLERLLVTHRLVDKQLAWTGGTATLWFMGDFTDRGREGTAVLREVMRLESEAQRAGGSVRALLGNHEVTLLAACRFPDERSTGPGGTFRSDWERNGGNAVELETLTEEQIAWIIGLPAMAHDRDRLFAHADATFYERYGESVEEVNSALRTVLHSADTKAWDALLHQFSEREAFFDSALAGTERAQAFLNRFGGKQFIHGHTPIDKVTGRRPETVTEAFVYAGGLCVNVDGGMYRGGPGFIYPVVSTDVAVL